MRMPGLTMRRPAGYPAHRSAASWVFDVLVTLLAVVAAAPSSTHGNLVPHVAAIGLLALSATPLLVRRLWPVPVFGVVLALNAGVGLWAHAVNGPALLIALYTVAALRPRRDALVCAGLLELGVVIGLLLFAGGNWWFDAIFASGMVAPRSGWACTRPPAGPTWLNCATARSGWNVSGISRGPWPRPPSGPGSPGRCTTSSPITSRSWSP